MDDGKTHDRGVDGRGPAHNGSGPRGRGGKTREVGCGGGAHQVSDAGGMREGSWGVGEAGGVLGCGLDG